MTTFVPSASTGVTWRFKTLYARHLQLSRLEVMEEIEPGHPELQRLKQEAKSVSRKSSSVNSLNSATRRMFAHMSMRPTASTPSLDSLSIGATPSFTGTTSSQSTAEFSPSTGMEIDRGSKAGFHLRPKRHEFEGLEAEVLPTA